ncbi:hypothetical protein K7X08_022028 [Anisodus acutangulus]|uniref:Uncharacterized protein n=1 Tax=Anisodus acutangulus TaxID=402998 RepID=A0A9Q1L406_9SOLA|nr:hypothetical protein K7X08_022028 [Anisodus acutangulus]
MRVDPWYLFEGEVFRTTGDAQHVSPTLEDIVELEPTTTDSADSSGSSDTPDGDHVSNTDSEELSTDSYESPKSGAAQENDVTVYDPQGI